jgi:DNA-binding MarR family transcriptional regulator
MEINSSEIRLIVSFYKTVADRIGVIEDCFLNLGRPAEQMLLMWEIGAEGIALDELRRRLDKDWERLEQALEVLEKEGMIDEKTQPEDRGLQRVFLTATGLGKVVELEQTALAAARQVVGPLSAKQGERLSQQCPK